MAKPYVARARLPSCWHRTEAVTKAEIITLRHQLIVFAAIPKSHGGSSFVARIGGFGVGFRDGGRTGVPP